MVWQQKFYIFYFDYIFFLNIWVYSLSVRHFNMQQKDREQIYLTNLFKVGLILVTVLDYFRQLKVIEDVQNALNHYGSIEGTLEHLARANDDIVRELLAFLVALLFNSNIAVQVILHLIIGPISLKSYFKVCSTPLLKFTMANGVLT